MGWVEKVTPWFAVVVLALAATWMAFAIYSAARWESTSRWSYVAVYAASLAGMLSFGVVAVRVAWPVRRWPGDAAVRVLTTVGLLFSGIAAPLVVLRPELGLDGIIVALAPLIVFYVRIRRPLADILPAWCGGTWKPGQDKRRPRRGEEVIKHPPRSWDETSGPARAEQTPAGGRTRKKQAKKKRRSSR